MSHDRSRSSGGLRPAVSEGHGFPRETEIDVLGGDLAVFAGQQPIHSVKDVYVAGGADNPVLRRLSETLDVQVHAFDPFGGASGSEGSERAKHTVAKNAYRLRKRGEPCNRIWYRERQEILYARTEQDRRRWLPADKAMIVASLDRTEARVARIVHAGVSGGAAKRFRGDGEPPSEDEEGGQ